MALHPGDVVFEKTPEITSGGGCDLASSRLVIVNCLSYARWPGHLVYPAAEYGTKEGV
jgi:hypothetical protein